MKIYEQEHSSVAIYWSNLGIAWSSLGQYETAIEYLEKALAVFQNVFGDRDINTKTVKESLDSLKKLVKEN